MSSPRPDLWTMKLAKGPRTILVKEKAVRSEFNGIGQPSAGLVGW
jgi:hypothetical protein